MPHPSFAFFAKEDGDFDFFQSFDSASPKQLARRVNFIFPGARIVDGSDSSVYSWAPGFASAGSEF